MKIELPSILKIVIKGEWYDEIAAKKKIIEYREVKDFWIRRLYDNNGKKRHYDYIEFINGYNSDARRMLTWYEGFRKKGDHFEIYIGKIVRND
jgi:hypothetical protein